MRLSDLPGLVGQQVIAVLDNNDLNSDETTITLKGKLISATREEFALQSDGRTVIHKITDLLEIERLPKKRRILIRYLRQIELGDIRQHLVDRHGWDVRLLRETSDNDAMELHGMVNHANLGHSHEPKPSRRGSKNGSTEPTDRAD